MGTAYDEDLMDNPFFQLLRKDFNDVFFNAIDEGCVICVPRVGCLSTYTTTLEDVLGHILVPSYEMPESHFTALNGREVKIVNSVLTIEYDIGCHFSTHILFEETYYTEDLHKYKVLCIEHPLEPKGDNQAGGIFDIRSLRDCIDMLWLESGNKKVTEYLDRAVEEFLNNEQYLNNSSMQTLKDVSGNLYAKCLQIVFKDPRLRDKASNSTHTLKNLKLAVESYLQHGIYNKLFKCISKCTSHDDAKLNKTIRNSVDLQPQDLEIPKELYESIPKARIELAKIDGYSTVLGKLGCLRKMMSAISKDATAASTLAADDLLPTIIFIVVKTNISNWLAQLSFMKQFHFSSHTSHDCCQESFLITMLEAAIEHIKSGVFLGPSCAEGQSSLSSDHSWISDESEEPTSMSTLFQCVAKGDLDKVRQILEKDRNILDFASLNLCHPLCVCDSCHKAVKKSNRNLNPTVHTCNDGGLTVLHIAAIYGQANIVDYLLTKKADTSSADLNGCTPLHHAALRGHQTALLLLVQYGADVNAADNSLNTPLHFCALNGHEGCVKALIYHCEHVGDRLLVNAQNVNGDTPLHNAAKWGYLSIVQLLIDNHADPCVINRRKASPWDLSSNPKVLELLTQSKPSMKVNPKQTNFDFVEESSEFRYVPGEKPKSTEQMRRVDKMIRAISNGDANLACFYLGVDPTTVVKMNCHPLCACPGRGTACTPSTFTKSLPINACNADGFTALHTAAAHGCVNLTQILVNNGAVLDVQTRAALSTPLILACQNQRLQVVSVLLEAGCDVNVQDNKGNTALHYGAIYSNLRLIEILLPHQPRLTVRNRSGRTALQEAEIKMALAVVDLLKRKLLEEAKS